MSVQPHGPLPGHAVCLGCSPNMTESLCGAPVDDLEPCTSCEWLVQQPCPQCQPILHGMWLAQHAA